MTIYKRFITKRTNRNLSFRRRHGLGQNLTSNEQVALRKSTRMLAALLVTERLNPDSLDFEAWKTALLWRHFLLRYTDDVELESAVNKRRTIESFGPSIKKDFRFEAGELYLLLKELKFPEDIVLDNGIVMTGEEVFLRGLYELVTGALQHTIADIFGRDFSAQSRAFNFFIDHVYDNHRHLVQNNLEWWYRNGFWEKSAKAIEERMRCRYPFDDTNSVSHFIDTKCLEASIPEVIRQIFWNINVPKTVFCEFLPKFQYGRLFFHVVRIGQMHIALVHTVRVFIQYNTLL